MEHRPDREQLPALSVSVPVEIAYFFVPLPEALALPDGFTLEVGHTETFDQFISRIEAADSALAADAQGPERRLTASLRFWHWRVRSSQLDAIEALFQVAQLAIPGLPAPTDSFPSAEPGDATVVEVAVPLSDTSEASLSASFDEGIRLVRGLQRAYHLVTKSSGRLVTRQRLPPVVPFGVRKISDESDEWPQHLDLFLVNTRFPNVDRGPTLDAQVLSYLREALDAQPGMRVFASYADLRRDARQALYDEGHYRAAAVFSAVAAEVLLDDMLAHMLWEEAMRPEDAATLFDMGLQTRVRTQYHGRLGGAGWGLRSAGAIQAWRERIAAVRHRVVHAGYEPTSLEAAQAAEALGRLESFLASRLIADKPLRMYPRTALAFWGRLELQSRNRWNSRLQRLVEDPTEPDWAATFLRWKAAMQRCRSEPPVDSVAPTLDRAWVVAVLHPGRWLTWVLHDREAHMACRALPPHPMTQQQSTALTDFVAHHSDLDAPISFAIHGARAAPAENASWIPEYRLLPMAGVMVNGQDLDSA